LWRKWSYEKVNFYSDQAVGKSDDLDKELLSLVCKKDPKIAYIPSCSDLTRKYYRDHDIYSITRLSFEEVNRKAI
jgi:hypothetical protein